MEVGTRGRIVTEGITLIMCRWSVPERADLIDLRVSKNRLKQGCWLDVLGGTTSRIHMHSPLINQSTLSTSNENAVTLMFEVDVRGITVSELSLMYSGLYWTR